MFATLEIDFNCMVVFVPDERAAGVGTVHALMPDTRGHVHRSAGSGGAGGGHVHGDDHVGCGEDIRTTGRVDEHVVRLYHRGVHPGSKGVDMMGWALDFSGRMADTTLNPLKPSTQGAEVVNLSTLSPGRVPRAILDVDAHRLAARVSVGYGATLTTRAEATWLFGNHRTRMAHRLVWRIEGLHPGAPLPWSALPSIQPALALPVHALSDFGADDDGVYRMSIFHVPASTLPPLPGGVGQLEPDTVREHFRVLYQLVGVTHPADDMLPTPDGSGGKVNCGLAQALFA